MRRPSLSWAQRAMAVGPAAPARTARTAMTRTLGRGCRRLIWERGSSKVAKDATISSSLLRVLAIADLRPPGPIHDTVDGIPGRRRGASPQGLPDRHKSNRAGPGNRPTIFFNTSLAPSRSWMPAEWTTAAMTIPSVSTTRCRLRPLTFLNASLPCGPPCSVVLTLWLSMIAHAGALLPAGSPVADLGAQGVVDLRPSAVVAPLAEVVVAGAPGGQVVGHHPPGAAAAEDVEDAVEDLAELDRARPAPGLGRRGAVA